MMALVNYSVSNVGGGFITMLFAGVLSGLLGIGSGRVKGFGYGQHYEHAVQGIHHHQ